MMCAPSFYINNQRLMKEIKELIAKNQIGRKDGQLEYILHR